MDILDPYYINGVPPQHFVGRECEELQVRQLWSGGALIEPCNVVYMKFGGERKKLCFEDGFVFWYDEEGAPVSYEGPEAGSSSPVVDIARTHDLVRHRLAELCMHSLEHGAAVVLRFDNGTEVWVQNENDVCSYEIRPV